LDAPVQIVAIDGLQCLQVRKVEDTIVARETIYWLILVVIATKIWLLEVAVGKSLETSKGSVWALFLTVHAMLVGGIERRLAQAGLPALAWYDVLWGLERAPGQRLRMSELADKVVLSRSNLTRLVDRLEDAGLVEREPSEEDRRGAYAVLTESGKAVRRSMWPVYAQGIKDLFESRLGEEEAAVMGATLRRLLAAAHTQERDGAFATLRRGEK
jgi:DNA-binding MarR family transcriptional regulator